MRWMAATKWRYMARTCALAAVVLLLIELAQLSVINTGSASSALRIVTVSAIVAVACLELSLLGSMFRGFGDNRRRMGLVMLPATNAEKFAALTVWTAVAGLLAGVAAYAAADTVRWLLYQVMGWRGGCGWGLPAFFSYGLPAFRFASDGSSGSLDVVRPCGLLPLLGILWTASLFVLSGALLRRLPVTAGFAVFVATIVAWVRILVWQSDNGTVIGLFMGHARMAETVLSLGLLLMAALNTWAAYRVFCRLTVGGRRWLNI